MKLKPFLLPLGMALLGLAGCGSIPLESITMEASPAGWKVAYAKDVPGKGNIIERIPKSETLKNWTKMVTIQFVEGERRTAQEFMDGLKASNVQQCPAAVWSVIESDRTSILYEWSIKGCSRHPDQHELARLLRGNDGMHRVAYVEKVQRLSKDVRNQWIANLKSAYLTKGRSTEPVVLKD